MIIDVSGIDKEDQSLIDFVLVDGPLNFQYSACSTSYRFPFMSHVLVNRNNTDITEIVSPFYKIFYDVFDKFTKKHQINYNKILRACINCTVPDERYEMMDPHVDQEIDHQVCIMYLNNLSTTDTSGATLIFDQTFPDANLDEVCDVGNVELIKKFTIKEEIVPKKRKIICFDGKHYHTIRPPKNGDYRFISIFNFV